MAYEFKKLSAVEVVAEPTESANVLIEENGVIKKAPKTAVGGIKVASTAEVGQTIVVKAVDENGNPTEWECADMSGSSNNDYDAVIDVGTEPTTFSASSATLVSGGYDNIKAKLESGKRPDIILRHNYVYAGQVFNTFYHVTSATLYSAGNSIGIYAYIANMYMGLGSPQYANILTIGLNKDNTITYLEYHHS